MLRDVPTNEAGEFPQLSEEERDRLIRQGLSDVDAGRTIPHREVLAWVKLDEDEA